MNYKSGLGTVHAKGKQKYTTACENATRLTRTTKPVDCKKCIKILRLQDCDCAVPLPGLTKSRGRWWCQRCEKPIKEEL